MYTIYTLFHLGPSKQTLVCLYQIYPFSGKTINCSFMNVSNKPSLKRTCFSFLYTSFRAPLFWRKLNLALPLKCLKYYPKYICAILTLFKDWELKIEMSTQKIISIRTNQAYFQSILPRGKGIFRDALVFSGHLKITSAECNLGKMYTQALHSTASHSTDFQIVLFLIGSKCPPTALFSVIFTKNY